MRKAYGKKDAEADGLEKELARSLGWVTLEKSHVVEAMNVEEGEDDAAENRTRDGEGKGEEVIWKKLSETLRRGGG